jgi:hypothetical protein
MPRRKVIPMFERSRNPRQFAFRVTQAEADRICAEARTANMTPTTYARRAALEKAAGGDAGQERLERRLQVLEDRLAAVLEQLASVAFELRDFRGRFDETVITASDDDGA